MKTVINCLAIITILLLPACSGTAERRKLEVLNDAIDNYTYALRWGRTDEAITYHLAEDGTKPEIDASKMDTVRVTEFSIRERNLNLEQTEATVRSEMNYYIEDSATVRTIEFDQRWWYEPGSGKWYIDSEFPDF